MNKFLRNNGLSLVLIGLFILFWVGQACVGRLEYNEEREERQLPPVSMHEYLHSSHFWEATGENWESEFLQMGAYVFLTAILFQKGSSESKDPDVDTLANEVEKDQAKAVELWARRLLCAVHARNRPGFSAALTRCLADGQCCDYASKECSAVDELGAPA